MNPAVLIAVADWLEAVIDDATTDGDDFIYGVDVGDLADAAIVLEALAGPLAVRELRRAIAANRLTV